MKKLLTLALSLALTATVGVASANTKLTVGASATPHAEILEAAKPILAEKGIDLEIVIFDDYVQPNLQLEAGDLDANYFQHIPYLENFNAENGTHLVSAGAVHYEPMGLYVNPAKSIALDSIPDGATIAIPNDTTNEARALLLLEENGYIKLQDGAGITATSGVCVTAGVLTISVGSACFVTHPVKISIIAAQSIRFIAFPPCHVFFYISIA